MSRVQEAGGFAKGTRDAVQQNRDSFKVSSTRTVNMRTDYHARDDRKEEVAQRLVAGATAKQGGFGITTTNQKRELLEGSFSRDANLLSTKSISSRAKVI
ncbi:hypothetical protein ACKVWC_007148 [Pyricularia oryzae]